jgi:hypothetical protein
MVALALAARPIAMAMTAEPLFGRDTKPLPSIPGVFGTAVSSQKCDAAHNFTRSVSLVSGPEDAIPLTVLRRQWEFRNPSLGGSRLNIGKRTQGVLRTGTTLLILTAFILLG